VELEGITGRVRVEGDEVSLDELSGSGSIVLPFPR
jgi:hypothetical protein